MKIKKGLDDGKWSLVRVPIRELPKGGLFGSNCFVMLSGDFPYYVKNVYADEIEGDFVSGNYHSTYWVSLTEKVWAIKNEDGRFLKLDDVELN